MTNQSTLRGAALLAVLVALPAPAAAQQGPASSLGDPSSGQAPPPVALPAPQLPEVEPERRAPAAADAPSYGAEQRVPPPPGYVPGGRARSEAELELDVVNRLRALDVTWATLSTHGGPNIGSAVMSLIGAGLSITIGALLLEFGDWTVESMAAYLFVLGGTSIVRTVTVEFILRPDPRGPAMEYLNMPRVPRSAALERLEYGETQLRALAERAWIARMVDGGLNIAGALAVVPAYLAPKGFELHSPFEAFIFLGPAFALVSGIITLASTSAFEQRWAAYDQMRSRLREQGDRQAAELLRAPIAEPTMAFDVSLDPRGGGVAFMRGTF